ncbi:tRNA pseudouridine(38-40) synthase TruA [Thermoflexus sp.]|uniref:tRNA pseudouridine(38-40) synthase TruA n=1 Tax=Thermoflexus sp. TaxID=1969742 RepID=UPI002ADDB5B6|nr:tRNA pseudouridine(38-40) synthase TruA [Thermoflexus sp.]
MRIWAALAYEGTRYRGFQRLAPSHEPTIQGVLEATLQHLAGAPIRVRGAGRTDAGVHAFGQVVAFDISWRHSLEDLQRALNALLPFDMVVWALGEAPPDFHPRREAQTRIYRYLIYNGPRRDPFGRTLAWHVPSPLDVMAMRQAAALWVGRHDFGAFGRPPRGQNTVREVRRAAVVADGEWVAFEIEADAFLYHMVRIMVAVLVAIGRGERPPEAAAAYLRRPDAYPAHAPAPPYGLYFVGARYERISIPPPPKFLPDCLRGLQDQ